MVTKQTAKSVSAIEQHSNATDKFTNAAMRMIRDAKTESELAVVEQAVADALQIHKTLLRR